MGAVTHTHTSDCAHTHPPTHTHTLHTVRALVLGAADARDPSVCGHDQDGRHLVLERAVEEREALDVQHVHLVNKQHLWVCERAHIHKNDKD